MKPIYITLLLIILTVGLSYQILLPMYNGEPSMLYAPDTGYKKLKQSMIDYQATSLQAETIIKQAKDLEDKYKLITEADIDLLKIMVPDSINEVKLHSEMAAILISQGFPTDKMFVNSKSGATTLPNAGSFLISFSLEDASYEKLKTFLNALERSKRIVVVKNINVTPAEKPGDIYKFDITAESYYLNIINTKK